MGITTDRGYKRLAELQIESARKVYIATINMPHSETNLDKEFFGTVALTLKPNIQKRNGGVWFLQEKKAPS